MGQQFRITYQQKDYNFQIISTTPVSRQGAEIKVLVNGITSTLIKDKQNWKPSDTIADFDTEHLRLTEAIGRNIALRFRI